MRLQDSRNRLSSLYIKQPAPWSSWNTVAQDESKPSFESPSQVPGFTITHGNHFNWNWSQKPEPSNNPVNEARVEDWRHKLGFSDTQSRNLNPGTNNPVNAASELKLRPAVAGLHFFSAGLPVTSQHSQSTHTNTLFDERPRLPDMNTLPPPPHNPNSNTYSEDVSSDEKKGCSRRGGEWKPEEDRALAKEVDACGVLQCAKGKSAEKWEEVSGKLQDDGFLRTGKSCKSRFSRLLFEQRVCQISFI